MEIQRQSEAFAYRLAAPPVSRHYSTKVLQGIHKTAADLVKDYTDNLYKEFHDWIDQQEFWPRGDTRPTDYTQPMGGPLTYWDNIEEFMKERYPAAYRGYSYGQEQAAPALDGYGMVFPVYPRQERTIPYETGPEAVSKYGYDPRQVAAGFMYLHSKAHNTARPTSRTNRIPRDIDRLSDIFQKRVEMQEKARQRKLVNANTIRCATDDYRGYHRGPDADYGSSMDNPDGVFPDIDTHPEYYDTYQPYDYESHHQIRRVRGKPDSWVTVYRALPLSVLQHKTYRGGPNDLYEGSKPYSYRQREAPINTNDWVTPSYSYAQEHGEANLSNEPWTIVQQRVRARSLFSEGNSIHEWAYNGEPIVGTEGDRARRERGLRTRKTKRSNTIRCAMPMMYHRTEPEWAKSIYEDKEFGGPNSVWFSDRPTGEGEVYGPAIVQLNIPDEVLKNHGEVEGEFPSGEKHWRVDLDAIKPEYFVDRAIKEARKLLSHNTIRCAADGGQQIYRGLHIDLNHPAAQRLRELVGPGSDLTNSEIGESLIEFLNANSPHPGYQFGPHWTTDFDVASKATGWRDTTAPNPPWPNPGHHSPGYPDQFHVVLKGRHHPGQMESPGFDTLPGTKTTYMWPSEKEITMAAGAPIRLEDIMIHGDTRGTWNSVLNQHRRIHA